MSDSYDWRSSLEKKPVVVAIAGSNGAGKSTFYKTRLENIGLRFVNADELAAEFEIDPYHAAALADAIRKAMIDRGVSFAFETVLSDPVGEKVEFLKSIAESPNGYHVILIFIRTGSVEKSKQRVSMRVRKGGHDVPDEKLENRFERTLANLDRAISCLPQVVVFDNSRLSQPYQLEAVFENGRQVFPSEK